MRPADEHRSPASRPADPAGSRPRHEPDSDRPARGASLLGAASAVPATPPATFGAGRGPAAERADEPGADAAGTPPVPTPHAARFQFLVGMLLAIGAAALVLFTAAIVTHDESASTTASDEQQWSAWQPASESANSTPQQIASFIAPRYRLDGGQQAALVDGGPLKADGLPLLVAVRAPASQGGSVQILQNKKSVLYRLCGLGSNCAVTPGKASAERHLLLRREGLELALYSFRYTDADQVVVFMPPRPGTKPTLGGQALFFQRKGLEAALKQPVGSVLTDDVPLPKTIARSADRLIVEQQTVPALYTFELKQANQDNLGFLVLDPIQTGSNAATTTQQSGSNG